MLRLSVLLCAAMFVTLLIAGKDGGPLRPGLATAVAEGREIRVIERQFAAPVELPAPVQDPVVATEVAVADVAPDPAPELAPDLPAVIEVAYTPEAPEPEPATRRVIPEPVFTLSALPSIGGDQVAVGSDLPEEPAAAPEAGNVWYVAAQSVNVRQGPSTDTSVVGKLSGGEAVTVIAQADSDWVQIIIQGDGLEGFVAARFLSASAP